MILFQQQPHWLVSTVIGAILGILLPYFGKAFYYMLRRFKKYYLEGVWNGYLYSHKDGVPIISQIKFKIRKGFYSQYKATLHYEDGTLSYKGIMKIENAQAYVYISSTQHEEHASLRFGVPIASKSHKIVGLWLSHDHDQYIGSGPFVLSRDPIKLAEIESTVESSIKCEHTMCLLRVHR